MVVKVATRPPRKKGKEEVRRKIDLATAFVSLRRNSRPAKKRKRSGVGLYTREKKSSLFSLKGREEREDRKERRCPLCVGV